jgi:hypothetical protein
LLGVSHDSIQGVLSVNDPLFTDHALPPSVSTEIPWDALDTAGKPYFSAGCIPNNVTTMNPDKMSTPECHLLYNHIFLLQDTPDAFAFVFTNVTDSDMHSPVNKNRSHSPDEQMPDDVNASGSGNAAGTQKGPQRSNKRTTEDDGVPDAGPAKKKRSM